MPVKIRRQDTIQPDEVIPASSRFIRQVQQEVFDEEVQVVRTGTELLSGSKLQPFKPVLDDDGILPRDEWLRYVEF